LKKLAVLLVITFLAGLYVFQATRPVPVLPTKPETVEDRAANYARKVFDQ
jgi:hypothetical protein